MKYMDKLPTVISCCFCCFLRAGTVMIAVFSFLILVIPGTYLPAIWICYSYSDYCFKPVNPAEILGIIFAPNVTQTPGFWDMEAILSNYSTATETAIQMTLGLISILLCAVSVLLVIGACCNVPVLIEVYQWGAIVYSSTVLLLFFILTIFCFFVHTNCYLAGAALCALMILDILLTAYFIIVVNSLRMSLKYLASDDLMI